jgi:hypothetical protein
VGVAGADVEAREAKATAAGRTMLAGTSARQTDGNAVLAFARRDELRHIFLNHYDERLSVEKTCVDALALWPSGAQPLWPSRFPRRSAG